MNFFKTLWRDIKCISNNHDYKEEAEFNFELLGEKSKIITYRCSHCNCEYNDFMIDLGIISPIVINLELKGEE